MEKRNTKAEVLEILLNSGETPVSGERLAENLGISRNAVWKAVTALKEEGYNISAKRNSGYILNKNNVLSVIEIKKHLNNPKIADSIEIHRLVSSTNNVAKAYALNDKTTDVRIFISEEQSGGKGRRGRSFYSPPGSGIYISFLFHPQIKAVDAVRLTTVTSVAVSKAIEKSTGLKPQIKWVNDVFFNGKKICGILTEALTDLETGMVDSVIIGIGVNVFGGGFPEELAKVAGALSDSEDCTDIDRNVIAAEIINQMLDFVRCDDGDCIIKDYIEDYKSRSMVLGERIKILNTGEFALVQDINESGALVLKLYSGESRILDSGEVSIRVSGTEK